MDPEATKDQDKLRELIAAAIARLSTPGHDET
jgi:hypothetical protein